MTTTDSKRGRIALMVGHCAGMVDLVVKPIELEALVSTVKRHTQVLAG